MPKWPKVMIAGKEMTVLPDDELEKCEAYLCMPWDSTQHFTDDLKDVCAMCGGAVRHRPHGPKKPMKICLPCGAAWMEATRN